METGFANCELIHFAEPVVVNERSTPYVGAAVIFCVVVSNGAMPILYEPVSVPPIANVAFQMVISTSETNTSPIELCASVSADSAGMM